jgi:hypothetical protein
MIGEQLREEEWRKHVLRERLRSARRRSQRASERLVEPEPGGFDYATQTHFDPADNPAAFFAWYDADAVTGGTADLADHLSRRTDPTEGI